MLFIFAYARQNKCMIHPENAFVCLFITLFYIFILLNSSIGNLLPMAKPPRELLLTFR